MTSKGSSMSTDTSFAEKYMKKMGWEHGQGLGTNRGGISEPITVSTQSDRTGLGNRNVLIQEAKEQFHPWWEDLYNKTVERVKVKSTTCSDLSKST
jgi:hypothetical protein